MAVNIATGGLIERFNNHKIGLGREACLVTGGHKSSKWPLITVDDEDETRKMVLGWFKSRFDG